MAILRLSDATQIVQLLHDLRHEEYDLADGVLECMLEPHVIKYLCDRHHLTLVIDDPDEVARLQEEYAESTSAAKCAARRLNEIGVEPTEPEIL